MQLLRLIVAGVVLACTSAQASTPEPLFVVVSASRSNTALIVYDDAAYIVDMERSSYGRPVNCVEGSMPLAAITTIPFSLLHEGLPPDIRLDTQLVQRYVQSVKDKPDYGVEIVSDVDAGVACYYAAAPAEAPGIIRLKLLGGYSPTLRVEAKGEPFQHTVRWLYLDVFRPALRAFEQARGIKGRESVSRPQRPDAREN